MMQFGNFETEMHLRFPDSLLLIRNMCDGGNTPGFRPHSGRVSPWAFPGADKFQTELANYSNSQGHFETEDQWLTRLKADIIIAFFGYNESFQGVEGLPNFKSELDAFIKHSLNQKYNSRTIPQLVIVSPIAFENLSQQKDLPDGKQENKNLSLYTDAMKEVALENQVLFIDAYAPSLKWFQNNDEPLTIDGFQMNEKGYEKFSHFLADEIFGTASSKAEQQRALVNSAVMEKNWMWKNDFKIPNGVHVFGRRYNPFGPDNYPAEIQKLRELTAVRDTSIWFAAKGKTFDLVAADKNTTPLPPVTTNYTPSEKSGALDYLYGQQALDKLKVPAGYKLELFASENEFPDLANPVQISFDNKGRLWVATMPSYPHYKPGDQKPNDKLIILEDTDNDGKADKQTIFAEGLHLPLGFEFAPEGVYVSQGTDFTLLKDTNGDDRADEKEIVFSGFDDHDTHHCIHAFCSDPSGAIYMGEGVFLHTNVETPYGPVRATNGGFYRYDVNRRKLERTAQLSIPNPWGIAFDEWGQNFFAETSSPDVRWMLPGTIKPRYGVFTDKSFDLIEPAHRVRPTSGLEFVFSSHFPDEVQGDLLINNTIGFLGMKQHTMEDDTTGYRSKHRADLIKSDDKNFRPVDMEFAPDGSLYIADWHNILIGHMQHNARDPLRDHVHGRIYRLTYPSRPLVNPAKVYGATIPELLNNLTLPEYRTRYRTRRELRSRDTGEVLKQIATWVNTLDKNDLQYEHHVLEALWVTWGLNKVDQVLLKQLLAAKDYRARAAAVRVLRYTGHQVKDQVELLRRAAQDDEGRVRLEAFAAASWLERENGIAILDEAGKKPLDRWMAPAYETAVAHINGKSREERKEEIIQTRFTGIQQELFIKGKEIYAREGYCMTCHQSGGTGLPPSGFPPLKKTRWVTGSEDRLIKLVLKGMMGKIEVLGHNYPGHVPMTPFEGMLNDDEVASVLTYIRNSFGNEGTAIMPEKVKAVREEIKDKKGFYSPEELLKEHPLEKR